MGATILIPAGTYPLTIPFTGSDGEEIGDLNLPCSFTPRFTQDVAHCLQRDGIPITAAGQICVQPTQQWQGGGVYLPR